MMGLSYHHLPTRGKAALNPQTIVRNKCRNALSVIASEAKQSMGGRRIEWIASSLRSSQ
jgi:hypothetical protein